MKRGRKGFTLLELMIVIGLMVIFAVLTIPYGIDFYQSRLLEEETRTISNVLARAQSHAVSGREDSDWGVRFFHEEGRYIFFKGSRFSMRDGLFDQEFTMSSGSSTEGAAEVVFEIHTGDVKVFSE